MFGGAYLQREICRNVGKAYFKLIRISFIWKPICNFKMLFQASLFD